MTTGPVLSCGWCDALETSWPVPPHEQAHRACTANHCAPLPENMLTPAWCPLRAQAIAALAAKPLAWAPRAKELRIEGPPGGRPLVSPDYENEDDPDD